MGKGKFVKTLLRDRELQKELKCFNEDNSTPTTIKHAGVKIVEAVYGGKKNEGINCLRYKMFSRLSMRKCLNLSTLSPTEAAAKQHCL